MNNNKTVTIVTSRCKILNLQNHFLFITKFFNNPNIIEKIRKKIRNLIISFIL